MGLRLISKATAALALACLSAALAGCPSPAPVANADAGAPPVALPDSDNPIDLAVRDAFLEVRHVPERASDAELCRRLFADLVGRYPTLDEVDADCVGRDVDEIARELQGREEYLVVSERHWRDRFRTTDVTVSWRYLKGLYALVDALHRGELGYEDFAMEALAHPGFLLTEVAADDRARRAFEVFLGRSATDAEAVDIGNLFRPWVPEVAPDPDFPYMFSIEARLYPFLCEPIASCEAELLGGAKLDFPGTPSFEVIRYEALSDAQRDVLKEPGRLFVRQPFFFEAAADEILDRLLDWDDGARVARTPGTLFPDVREAVARYLRDTGDVPGAERLVLTSWLYTQSAEMEGADPEAPVFTSGPVKPALAEVWLDSALRFSAPFSGHDPRYSDGFPYFLIYDALGQGTITLEQAEEDFQRLNDMREDRMPLWMNEGYLQPDYRYTFLVRLIGGAPGFDSERQEATGLAFAFQQESLAELVCLPEIAAGAIPEGDLDVGGVMRHQMRALFAREPTAEEVEAFEVAAEACEGASCTPLGRVNAICVALLGSAEMLFY